jgi:hypothetical protein
MARLAGMISTRIRSHLMPGPVAASVSTSSTDQTPAEPDGETWGALPPRAVAHGVAVGALGAYCATGRHDRPALVIGYGRRRSTRSAAPSPGSAPRCGRYSASPTGPGAT